MKEDKKKMQEYIEKSSFEDDMSPLLTNMEEKKQTNEKLSYEEIKLPAANDQGFSNTFKSSTESESPLIMAQD